MAPSPERALIWFLRLTAVTLLAALLAVVMPYALMNEIHRWLGLSDLPDMPIVGYLTRSLSALYAFLGVICWFVSYDVRRYLPLLQLTVPGALFLGAALCAIDVLVEMPAAWMLVETVFVLLWASVLWWLVRRIPS
jgi:hypothetical protein